MHLHDLLGLGVIKMPLPWSTQFDSMNLVKELNYFFPWSTQINRFFMIYLYQFALINSLFLHIFLSNDFDSFTLINSIWSNALYESTQLIFKGGIHELIKWYRCIRMIFIHLSWSNQKDLSTFYKIHWIKLSWSRKIHLI